MVAVDDDYIFLEEEVDLQARDISLIAPVSGG